MNRTRFNWLSVANTCFTIVHKSRLRVVPFYFASSVVRDAKENREEKNGRVKSSVLASRPQDFTRLCFPSGFR